MRKEVQFNNGRTLEFDGVCIASVCALNHDDTVRRRFLIYRCESGYVAQRVDDPDTVHARYWAAECSTERDIYDFFGNEPLANYLYGRLKIRVPGLDYDQ
ncbi:MAG: hypothetical protein KTR32_24880 [Granulosicoccus sp.]|nr:hypothetical protein [Granulosicoccus sp.]